MHPANRLRNLRRRVARARRFPTNTCPASRHLHELADDLLAKRIVREIEEPEAVAGSILAVLEALWKARTELARVKAGAK